MWKMITFAEFFDSVRQFAMDNDPTKFAKKEDEREFKMSGTNFSYGLFRTNAGKGYGCFAIQKVTETTFLVAGSFCSPGDRPKFSKKLARKVAEQRLNSSLWGVEIECKSNNYNELIESYLVLVERSPGWAYRAYRAGNYAHTLASDNEF
jgi:hypothetical protein